MAKTCLKYEKSCFSKPSRLGGLRQLTSEEPEQPTGRASQQRERVEALGTGEGVEGLGRDRPEDLPTNCQPARAPRGETRVRGVRGSGKPARRRRNPRVPCRAGRWAEGGSAQPRGSTEVRGREGRAQPRNGQARQPMDSRSCEIKPITARGRATSLGGAGAHPEALAGAGRSSEDGGRGSGPAAG